MFEKNLESISNAALKRRLTKISPIESRIGVSYCITPSNDYVLLKNELATDDLNNPREAIRTMIKKTVKSDMLENDSIITFGIGLGYLLDEVFNQFPSKIYIYEPDLNLLHFVLNNVDISEHLSSGRVYITNDLDELTSKLSSSFLTKDKIEILYLQNYAVGKNTELLLMTQKVLDACKSKIVDINTITKFSKQWITNTINNIAKIQNGEMYLLSDLKDKFQGQTAIIAAAGPSLNENIDFIKANRNKFVIFAVNKAIKFLTENGVFPDFVVCLDAKNMKKTLEEVSANITNCNCIMDIRTDYNITSLNFKKFFINFAETDFFIKNLNKYNDFMVHFETGGSASTFALISAIELGFSKIIFSGVDLAFKENIIYSDGQKMERISQDEIIVDKVKKNLTKVKSVTGAPVYTREDYQTFIHHFTTLIKEYNHTEIYNTSSFGADIQGAINTNFNDIVLTNNASLAPLAFIKPFKFELNKFIQTEFYNINQIILQLSKGMFSPTLVNAIINSALVYQYMQAETLEALQKNFAPELAENFITKTKSSIKIIIELLQKNKLI